MTATLIAIDTATDACSLALQRHGERRARHEVIPRQHQQRLFTLLRELLDGEALSSLALDAIVFGRGPGSFTGLRIAASAAQGLAYSQQVPVIGVSTLETQVHTYLRQAPVETPCLVLSTIDARIGQIYAAVFRVEVTAVRAVDSARLCVPEDCLCDVIDGMEGIALHCIGTGFTADAARRAVADRAVNIAPQLLPEAVDMLPLAEIQLRLGMQQSAAAALPDYLQERTGWKTLAEQGRRP